MLISGEMLWKETSGFVYVYFLYINQFIISYYSSDHVEFLNICLGEDKEVVRKFEMCNTMFKFGNFETGYNIFVRCVFK